MKKYSIKSNAYVISPIAALIVALSAIGSAQAQQYPARPVRTLVPLAAGGGMDTVTRGLSLKLSDAFSQSFVVDNRPGAGSQIALEIMANAAPDGHTLMMLSATTVVHPLLYKSRFDIVRDFAPIAQVTSQGYVLVVHPSIPAKSVAEFVQHLKANPDKVNFSSSGIGSLIHMSGELFKIATGTQMTHVPYKGMGAAYTDLIGGQVQSSFPTIISSIAHINSGRLRPLAVTPAKRVPALPNTPTFAEAGVKGVVVVNWYGLIAPAKTPAAIVNRLASEATKAMLAPDMAKSLLAEGSEPVRSSPAEFAAHIKAESELWTRVVKTAGIKGL
ncbi:MAG: tripartite tricarboxylate transporter substrate binding protein [Betaproteobacteria bacterium]|nr:tripartite tricarboxylate transporter substrate binding protein [Betaproteobacteria bacterium]